MTLAPFDLERQIRQDSTCVEGYFQLPGVQPNLHRKGAAPAIPNFLEFPSIYPYNL